jgi:membrane protease YdiL (CAAX protease family)
MQDAAVRFGVRQAIGVTAAYVILSGVGSMAVDKLARTFLGVGPAPAMLGGMIFGFLLATGLLLAREESRGRWRAWPREEWVVPRRALAAWLLAVLALGVVLSEVDNWFRYFWAPPRSVVELFQLIGNVRENPVLIVTAVVVVGPICEEFILRGVVLRGLLRRMTPNRAILLSAFLFSLMHLNPWQAIATFVIGLLLGWAYVRTRSLGLCIVAHVANNALAVGSTLVADWVPGFGAVPGMTEHQFQPWWFTTLAAGLLVAGLAAFARATPPPAPIADRVPPRIEIPAG